MNAAQRRVLVAALTLWIAAGLCPPWAFYLPDGKRDGGVEVGFILAPPVRTLRNGRELRAAPDYKMLALEWAVIAGAAVFGVLLGKGASDGR